MGCYDERMEAPAVAPEVLLSFFPDLIDEMGQDHVLAAWESHSGHQSVRLSRCIFLSCVLSEMGVESSVVRAMPRTPLPGGVGTTPSMDIAFAVHIPALDVRVGPTGAQGEEAIVKDYLEGHALRPDQWKEVPSENIEYERGFMDIEGRMARAMVLLQARLLECEVGDVSVSRVGVRNRL